MPSICQDVRELTIGMLQAGILLTAVIVATKCYSSRIPLCKLVDHLRDTCTLFDHSCDIELRSYVRTGTIRLIHLNNSFMTTASRFRHVLERDNHRISHQAFISLTLEQVVYQRNAYRNDSQSCPILLV